MDDEVPPLVYPNKIKVSDFLIKWAQTLPLEYFLNGEVIDESNLGKSALDIPPEMINELEEVCGPHTLQIDSSDAADTDRWAVLYDIPKESNLVSLRILREHLAKKKKNYDIHDRGMTNYHMDTEMPKKQRPEPVVDAAGNQINSHFAADVVLTIQVCDPFHTNKALVMDKEYIVLGQQYLTELRDKIKCSNDVMVAGDFSHDLSLPQDIKAKDLYKSGFFFIGGTFYNDMRDPNNRDYSQNILKWASERDRGMDDYKTAKMELSSFQDLTIELGVPYVYVHQGDCEHLIVFTSIRMLHEADNHIVTDYPIITKDRMRRLPRCRTCAIFTAKWFVKGSHLLMEDPCVVCEKCLRLLHYDKSGNKIGDFTVHLYVDQALGHLMS